EPENAVPDQFGQAQEPARVIGELEEVWTAIPYQDGIQSRHDPGKSREQDAEKGRACQGNTEECQHVEDGSEQDGDDNDAQWRICTLVDYAEPFGHLSIK